LAWKLVEKKIPVNRYPGCLVFKRNSAHSIHIYISAELRRKLGWDRNGWCNVYQSEDDRMLLIQFLKEPMSKHSRSIKAGTFSLPDDVLNGYWDFNGRYTKKIVSPIVEKGNLIVKLKDLK